MSSRIIIKLVILVFYILLGSSESNAQGGYYGFQISPGLSLQKWNNSSRDPLVTINGDLFISAYGSNKSNVFYAKIGYHQRGSKIYNRSSGGINSSHNIYVFHNLGLGAGVQKIISEHFSIPIYYILGFRIEYTIGTNLKQFDIYESYYHPNNIFVNKFNYGADFGAGTILKFNPNFDLFIELIVSPDFSLQYEQEPIFGQKNPYTNKYQDIPKKHVRNLSMELSVGIRFNQK